MALTFLVDRQYTAPSAANSVSIAPAGVNFGNSDYVTVLASTPAACVLTGIIVSTTYGESISVTHDFEVDIATGTAGAEVVIATVRGHNSRPSSGAQAGPTLCCVLPIPIDNIAAGVRVAARMRKAGTATTPPYQVAITYLQKPLASSILTTAVPQTVIPSGVTGHTVTAGSPAWASGAWTECRAASGPALVVTGFCAGGAIEAVQYELDLGTGPAGSESVITTFHLHASAGAFPSFVMLPTPLDAIAAATRVAARLRCQTASKALVVSIMVLEKPL